jgi:hypothetical protein
VRLEAPSTGAAPAYLLLTPASVHRPEGVRDGDELSESRVGDWMVQLLRLVPEGRNAQVRALGGTVTGRVVGRAVFSGRAVIGVQYRGSVRYALTPAGGAETTGEASAGGYGLIDIETGIGVHVQLRLTVQPSRVGPERVYQITERATFPPDFRVLP